MDYKSGYLAMFTALTQLKEVLEKTDPIKEYLEVPHFLRAIQQKGEEACIAREV